MSYNRTNIIASLATTPGISAISIIRISGENLRSLFQSITQEKTIKDRYALYCTIFNKNQDIIFQFLSFVFHILRLFYLFC